MPRLTQDHPPALPNETDDWCFNKTLFFPCQQRENMICLCPFLDNDCVLTPSLAMKLLFEHPTKINKAPEQTKPIQEHHGGQ